MANEFKGSFSRYSIPVFQRDELIERNEFYAKKAKDIVLCQFTDDTILAEADRVEREVYKASGEWCEEDGPSKEGVMRYTVMSDMRYDITASIVAGLFQEWDKSLRRWLSFRAMLFQERDKTRATIWAAKFPEIISILDSMGWSVRDAECYDKIEACSRVVNMYKHGGGKCLSILKKHHPEYLQSSNKEHYKSAMSSDPLDGSDRLVISEAQIDEFTDAFTLFWREFPEYHEPWGNAVPSHLHPAPTLPLETSGSGG